MCYISVASCGITQRFLERMNYYEWDTIGKPTSKARWDSEVSGSAKTEWFGVNDGFPLFHNLYWVCICCRRYLLSVLDIYFCGITDRVLMIPYQFDQVLVLSPIISYTCMFTS